MEFNCTICPRKCGRLRNDETGLGLCRAPAQLRIARAGLHMWEEPCVSGSRGSGTIFFSGCNLGCAYCQNYDISARTFGKNITVPRLYDIFLELIEKGAHNINLVTPTHYSHILIKALERPLPVPVIWNTSGYESIETLRALEGKVQVYLTDLKYLSPSLSEKYSGAPDYPDIAKAAVDEMLRQTGQFKIGGDGLIESGVIVRHLVLPENLDSTFDVIDYISEHFKPGDILFSLMSQYTPAGEISAFPELRRRISEEEYERVYSYLSLSGIEDGFFQLLSSAKEEYIPDFDLTGV